jgi:hypothetical protein
MDSSTKTPLQQYIDALSGAIKPGTCGAPARRDKYQTVAAAHLQHIRNLKIASPAAWEEKSREHRAIVLASRGCEFYGQHYAWAVEAQQNKKKYALTSREQSTVRARMEALPTTELIAYYVVIGQRTYDDAWGYHTLSNVAAYCAEYLRAKPDYRISGDDSIYKYAESTEWEKYGKRFYPRVCDRRIEKITRTKTETVIYLGNGERAETALNALLPNRATQQKIDKLIKECAKIDCYKVVAKTESGLASIFDSNTTYALGVIATDTVKRGRGAICTSGGIFVHKTIEAAKAQKFPRESSDNRFLPRVLVRGEAWGKKNIDEKIAAEYFIPLEIVETL